ncbi:hypothetical protein ACFWUP_21815 [Nocardia sp. NPDC058658]|uniref:hypothetical protein n=1 Tax=Nocardia sp. NPDC058658 TaxID=3346580 RepID=UPI003662454B
MDNNSTHIQEAVRRVPIPWPWDPHEYVHRVAQHRGRPIIVCPIDPGALSGTGCGTGSGLWLAREDDDIIMVGAETPWHADHILAHEIGHMLLDHDTGARGETHDDLPLQALMPALDPAAIRNVLRRRDYETSRERDAETFAGMVMVEASLPRRSQFRSTFFLGRP